HNSAAKFSKRSHKDPPNPKTIRRLVTTGCLCKGKSPGRPGVPQETVQRVRACFQKYVIHSLVYNLCNM
ncbi:hypothetical protein C0J52_22362, partial [Blattella germanica]